ncbi:hypothetical protein EHI8A_147350 [Entamoeba histolytica HM-1:IMSS-B]|uniref:Uncharacterized protein n=6 Tax=Entamoeba histolytica TaxID=5759 RepID=B1N4R1_ENTH1|nr:hypothetical protein EHI_049180 [Entamoeba histolytica HM-1:IMSS]XP_647914.1 hypothetical protein EHI_085480 [Entamoeba histolytica HM-1:IMSS]EMD47597.1 Hypothetical protein EHI5A_185030 [Entamoeba histolytica KU27]EMH76350.1 hypothetical protein EHI8A_147350 [Entamoeba histolytica HM-1:IMSS-B]EMS11494.1 hypothetical protein KM1_227060 [Entamoeba histolytica HM-3:IMSS]ENY62354.1 hypothetical protein EHI7A_135090 [Entamoeba histolytica HM-1:IMSS-A]GAT98752.1 hypothetical protein CL6EHI_0491|eukprot:XP_001914177.1 hypothetical protein EHI_049180 [Entamoeba histolytica HM-1:IMSS]
MVLRKSTINRYKIERLAYLFMESEAFPSTNKNSFKKLFVRIVEQILHDVINKNDEIKEKLVIGTIIQTFSRYSTKSMWKRFSIKKFGSEYTGLELRNCFLACYRRLLNLRVSSRIIDQIIKLLHSFRNNCCQQFLTLNKNEFHPFFLTEKYTISYISYLYKNHQYFNIIQKANAFPEVEILNASCYFNGYLAKAAYQYFLKDPQKNSNYVDLSINYFCKAISSSGGSPYYIFQFISFLRNEGEEDTIIEEYQKALDKKNFRLMLLSLIEHEPNKCDIIHDMSSFMENYLSQYPYDHIGKKVIKSDYIPSSYSLTLQVFVSRFEFPYSEDEYYELWRDFKIYLENNQIPDISSIYPFSNHIWKRRHFPLFSHIVKTMDLRLIEIKKVVFKLIYNTEWKYN